MAGLKGFGTATENVSLYKDFEIKERMKLQIRAEFYNVFNRHAFDNPDTNIASSTFGNVLAVAGASFSRQFHGKLDLTNAADPSNQYFSTQPFSNPTFGSFGDSGPYVAGLNGFGTASADLSIIKEFRMRERFRFQLRGEFYDVLNLHYYNNPSTDIASPYFGMVQSVSATSRVGQVGIRFQW